LLPRTEIAFRLLLPMTAPTPPLAAALASAMTAASTSFLSPAGPMLNTLIGFFDGPWSFLISDSVRHVSMPHRFLALSNRISSSCMWILTGSAEAPSRMMPS